MALEITNTVQEVRDTPGGGGALVHALGLQESAETVNYGYTKLLVLIPAGFASEYEPATYELMRGRDLYDVEVKDVGFRVTRKDSEDMLLNVLTIFYPPETQFDTGDPSLTSYISINPAAASSEISNITTGLDLPGEELFYAANNMGPPVEDTYIVLVIEEKLT